MSIDRFHFVRGDKTTDIEHEEATVLCGKKEADTIYVMWGGVEQVGERLPLNSVPNTAATSTSWDGDFDTDGDPNGLARWKVRCGRPVAGTVAG
jgi:hypothetical protein